MLTPSTAQSAAGSARPAVVTGLAPRVLMMALEPTTGLALWRRRGRAASRRGAQAALTLAPFCKVAEGPPDHATLELLKDMPAASRPLGADIRLLGRLFATLTASSTVRFRLEHVVDDACRQHHVDSVGLRLLCTYAGLGTGWIDPAGAERRMAAFDVGVFKGSKFPDSAPRILHRSPPVEHLPERRRSRLLLCIDQPGVF
jgi:Protein of unknown function (DUF1826)